MSRTGASSALRRGRRRLAPGLIAVVGVVAGAGPPEASAARCPHADARPGNASRQAIARATVCLINAERRSRGLGVLRSRPRLSKAALRHSRDMVRRRYFSHTAPDGSTLQRRVRRSGYLRSAKRWALGETLAWGTGGDGTARAVMRGWMRSPPHRDVIVARQFRDLGVGIAWGVPDGDLTGGATYTVDFGVRG